MTQYPFADLSIRADVSELRRASAWLSQEAVQRGVPSDQIQRLDLCLNEALANVIAYGGAGALQAPINIELKVSRAPGVTEAVVTVSDAGEAFDPLNTAPRTRASSLADAVPGGFGITMIRSLANKVGYRYDEGLNRLSLSVVWQEAR